MNPYVPPTDPETPKPFRPPGASDAPAPLRSMVYLLACLVWSGLAIKMMVLRPILRSLFQDFGVELPVFTRWLLHPSLSVLLVVIAAGLILVPLVTGASEGRRWIGRYAVAFALVMLLLLVIGLGLPLLSLLRALS